MLKGKKVKTLSKRERGGRERLKGFICAPALTSPQLINLRNKTCVCNSTEEIGSPVPISFPHPRPFANGGQAIFSGIGCIKTAGTS
jgi:hypothetical protein